MLMLYSTSASARASDYKCVRVVSRDGRRTSVRGASLAIISSNNHASFFLKKILMKSLMMNEIYKD